MTMWIWQLPAWPNFTYDTRALQQVEQQFLRDCGFLLGAFRHISPADQEQLKIELVGEEAIETSAIEGEYLDRASVQSSLRRNFGLVSDNRNIPLSEQGVAYMLADLYKNFSVPLSDEILFDWHAHLMSANLNLGCIGGYRQHIDPMQIVSGGGNKFKIHYEAPPSTVVPMQMQNFINWFNQSLHTLPAITRAAIAHLYFELIHPFEDGNGRIGRAIAKKSIAQSLEQPLLLAISHSIQQNKKQYYAALAACNHNLDITNWLLYFADLLNDAQHYTQQYIDFIIAKTKLYDRVQKQLNLRQAKVIQRIFQEGVKGFIGGLSAENYIAITKTSRATATRDLQDLISKGVVYSTGERKSTRYFIKFDSE